MIGGWEWLIIGVIVVLLFGTQKLPALGKGLGDAIQQFKKAAAGEEDPRHTAGKTPEGETPPAPTTPEAKETPRQLG